MGLYTHTHTRVLENNNKKSSVQKNGKSIKFQNIKYVENLKNVEETKKFKRDREKGWYSQKAGITLIALVITIIVLMILAGISITMISGQDGILTRAGNAKTESEKATIREKIKLAIIASYDENGILTAENVIANIRKSLPDAGITGEDFPITVTEGGYTFEIDSKGDVKQKGPSAIVSEVKVVENSDGTGEEAGNDKEENTELYISFKTSIENGTIKSVTCDKGTVEKKGDLYVTKVTANGTYKFTIIGTVDGQDWTTEYAKIVDKYAKRAGIKVGDYINYTPDSAEAYASSKLASSITGSSIAGSSSNSADLTQDTLTWQVLRIYEDGSMDLIGSPTSKDVYFQGALGYNNGVYVMNDICESLYSKKTKGITARSVNLEDMEKWLTDDVLNADGTVKTKGGKTARAEYKNSDSGTLYGQTKTYTGGYTYKPDIYGKTENESDKYYSTPTDKTYTREYGTDGTTYTLEAKQTYYNIAINSTNYGDGAKALTASNYYWVASRYVGCDSNYAYFGLRFARDYIRGDYMFGSNNDYTYDNYRLRPVVSLGSDIQVEKCSGENRTDNMHTINWN